MGRKAKRRNRDERHLNIILSALDVARQALAEVSPNHPYYDEMCDYIKKSHLSAEINLVGARVRAGKIVIPEEGQSH